MIISHTLILLSPFHLKTPLQNLHTQFRPKPTISLPSIFNPWKLKTYKIQSKAAVRSDGEAFNWKKWLPRKVDFGPDKVLQSIAGATSSPICQFITSPTTFLHIVDPRIKLVIFLSFYLILGIFKCLKLWLSCKLNYSLLIM